MGWLFRKPAGSNLRQLRSELRFIRELCMVIAATSELQPVLDWIVQRTAVLLKADECCIKHASKDRHNFESTVAISRPGGPGASTRPWPDVVRQCVLGHLLSSRSVLATPDLPADPRFRGFHALPLSVRALLAVPMHVNAEITGMLAVSDTRPGRVWSREDIELLTIVAGHAASGIEMARLRVEAAEKDHLQREQALAERELLLARTIQMHLVPSRPLALGCWLLDGRVLPARQLGGDHFNYFEIGPARAALVIADVMGKSVPAALVVFALHGMLRSLADGRRSPLEVVTQLNRSVGELTGERDFVTLFYGELDAGAEELRYVNAGHNHPLLRRAGGDLERLGVGGPPLGIDRAFRYEEAAVPFGEHDALLMFSDGIVEAMDPFQRMFGDQRLETLWAAVAGGQPESFLERLMAAVREFRGEAEQSDDMTAVSVYRWEEARTFSLASAEDQMG